MMIAVIIAGGSGSRLWPLSTPDYPKHLLAVGSQDKTLLQQTYDRIKQVADHIYVITEQSHDTYVCEQLSELPKDHCIVEPARRGTANCTLLALNKIKDSYDDSESIVILWADHYIRDVEGFSHTLTLAQNVAQREEKIVLVGIEPSYAATGFGYIKKKSVLQNELYVHTVDSFKEKPDSTTAEGYLRSGRYLWNSGYIIATVKILTDSIRQYAPTMQKNMEVLAQTTTYDGYANLDVANIDNSLIENVPELLVVPATFDWMDLGSYSDLHQASESDSDGNSVKGYVKLDSVENSLIQNHEDKPLLVIGLDNVAVVNTENGILVTRKDLSQAVGALSKQVYSSDDKKEER